MSILPLPRLLPCMCGQLHARMHAASLFSGRFGGSVRFSSAPLPEGQGRELEW